MCSNFSLAIVDIFELIWTFGFDIMTQPSGVQTSWQVWKKDEDRLAVVKWIPLSSSLCDLALWTLACFVKSSPRIWLKLAFVAHRTAGVLWNEKSWRDMHWRSDACSASFLELSSLFNVCHKALRPSLSCLMNSTSAAPFRMQFCHPLCCGTTRTISKWAVRQTLCNFQAARCFVQVHHHLQAWRGPNGVKIFSGEFFDSLRLREASRPLDLWRKWDWSWDQQVG